MTILYRQKRTWKNCISSVDDFVYSRYNAISVIAAAVDAGPDGRASYNKDAGMLQCPSGIRGQ